MSRTCPDCHNAYDDDVLHCPEDGRGLSDVPVIDELIGRQVGSYKVIKMLGKGGMGAVYMGEHPVIGSKVAIKFLHPQYAHDDKIVDRFFNEARAVNVIGHDNILKILDLNVTEDNRHFFVMEYLHGRAVQNMLRHGASMPLEITGPIFIQCCDALEAAHKKGIVHRDLKPDNVYLITMKGKKNFVKVVDFGIARVTDDAGASTGKTQTGMVMGTPAYMSPEQGSGATSKIDGRSDVYSLGVMMYQLATGKLPFPGSNFGEVLVGHLQQPPPPPRGINPDIPEAYEQVILKCLEKRQEDRYQTMGELRSAISSVMDALGFSKDLPPADETDPELPMSGMRTPSQPGRATGPGAGGPSSRPRTSQPGVKASNPKLAGGPRSNPNTGAHAMAGRSRPPTMPPEPKSNTGMLVGIIAAVVLVAGGVVAYVVKSANDKAEQVAQKAARETKAAARAEAQKADDSAVFLSIVSEPLEADVTATWKDGEKKGTAPMAFEVPHNAKVHFEFSKDGYVGYAMDVIADQAQNVRATLKPQPQAAAGDPGEKKAHKGRRDDKPAAEKKESVPSKDGLIDLDDALK